MSPYVFPAVLPRVLEASHCYSSLLPEELSFREIRVVDRFCCGRTFKHDMITGQGDETIITVSLGFSKSLVTNIISQNVGRDSLITQTSTFKCMCGWRDSALFASPRSRLHPPQSEVPQQGLPSRFSDLLLQLQSPGVLERRLSAR